MDSKKHIELSEKYGAHNYHPLEVVISKAHGSWVYDAEGKRYFDMLTAYSAVSFGHSNPRIIDAARRQLERITLCSRAFYNDQFGPFARDLAELCGMEAVLPMNSGAEAVETALKIARKWGYERKGIEPDKAEIITFRDNFHGRTTTITGFSTVNDYRKNFGPFTPGFVTAAYGDIRDLERLITKNTAALLIEPIQGEGGIIIPPEGYLKQVRSLCSSNRILMLADEIQTGLCRTGRLFACDHEDVKPDMYILGKALGGSVIPVSAVVSTRAIMDVLTPGVHGSTFGGNSFACAVASEVIALIREEKPEENSKKMGEYFLAELAKLKLSSSKISAVRGRGLFIGVDIKSEHGEAIKYCELLRDEGVLCKDTRKQTIRFAPSLLVTRDELNWALEQIRKVLT